MKLHLGIACLLSLAATASANAQNMKPGLWEISTQMQGSGQTGKAMAEAQKQMESMPPEQRKMMQDMMASKGMQMGGPAGGGGMTIKVCMTQEMVDRNEVGRQQPGCTHTYGQRSGNTMKFSWVCTQPPSSGEGQVTFTSPEAYSMKMTSTSTVRGNPEEKMDMQTSGRWLGGDCGNIKPLAVPKK
jgi:hypothetical protein